MARAASGRSDPAPTSGYSRERPSPSPIRVVVVAETRLYREGLVTILCRDDRIQIVGSSSSPDAGIEDARANGADVLLLDIGAAGGPDGVGRVVDALPQVAVVAFGIAESEDVVIRCAEAGVAGYVAHDATLDALVAVLEGVLREEVVCSPRLAGTLLRRVGALARERDPGTAPDDVRLTSRETQIMALIDQGLSNKEIAARLWIGLPTVKNHVHHILEKMGVRRRAEAAARLRALRDRR